MDIKVVIVDSQTVMRSGLRSLLNDNGIKVLAEAKNIAESDALADSHRDAIFIIDINLDPDGNAFPLIPAYKAKKIKVIVYNSLHLNPDTILLTYRAGALAVVPKNANEAHLIEAIKKASNGENYFMPGVAEQLMSYVSQGKLDSPSEILSESEFKVFMLTAAGKKAVDIAKELDFSVGTIHNRLSTIRVKLNCSNLDMHKIAQQHGLIS